MARFLSPKDFGLYAFANIFFVTTRVVAGNAFVDSLVQKRISLSPLIYPAFWIVCLVFFLSIPLISGLGFLLEKPLRMPGLFPVLSLLSLGFFSFGLGVVPEAICVEKLNFRPLAIRRMVEQLVGGLFGVYTAILGWGVFSLVAQVLTGSAFGTALLWSFTRFRPKLTSDFSSLMPLRVFFLNRLGTVLAGALGMRLDSFFVGALLGPVALGFYSVAWRLYTVTSVFTNLTINRFAFPFFVSQKGDCKRIQQSYRTFTHLSCMLGSMGYLALFSLANPLLYSFFGNQWGPAIPVLLALAFLGTLGNTFFVGNLLLRALGRADLEFRCVIFPTIANLCLLPFTTSHGLIAVVITLLFSSILTAPLLLFYLKKESGINFSVVIKSGFRPWIAGSISSMVTLFFLNQASLGAGLNSTAQLILGSFIFAFTFLFLTILIDRKFFFFIFSKNFL